MQEFFPHHFFSLECFEHRAVFDKTDFVWMALHRLFSYMERAQLGKIEIKVPTTVYLKNIAQISIAPGCVIEPGAYIEGPVILGPKTVVRHGAYVRGYVITGNGCVIGHATEVKQSILLDGAQAAHFNYVGDSILGCGANLGAGVKLANYRLDHEPVAFLYQGKKIETGLKKFGAIIGDGAQLGCNAVTNPATFFGKGSFCRPCANVKGFIAAQTIYRDKER